MITKGLMSSNTDEWATPREFYKELNKEFNFTLDPCATHKNHKCEKYYTKEDNGLTQTWGGGDSLLQPSVWARNKQMGRKSIQ